MPYMMSDLAEGSKAVNQLQQNIAAAPYVGDLTKAASERKIQEDRLAAQYAPQQAALEQQQAEANLQKSKLASTVLESGIKVDADKKAAITKLTAEPTWATLSASEQQAKMASAIMAIDPTDGEKLLNSSVASLQKEALVKAKEADRAREVIGSAYSAIAKATPEEVQSIINQMPPDQRKAIEAQIPGFFKETNSKLQKSQLENLLLNANGHTLAMKIESNIAIEKMREENKLQLAAINANNQKAKREEGASNRESKQDLNAYNAWHRAEVAIDREYKDDLKTAKDNVAKAEKQAQGSRMVGIQIPFTKTTGGVSGKGDAYDEAVNKHRALEKEIVEKKLSRLEELPEGPQKERQYKLLMNQLELSEKVGGEDKPTSPPPAPDASGAKGAAAPSAAPASADAAPVVPSNKGAVGTQAAPIPFEPGKTIPENGKYYINNNKQIAMWDESKKKMVAGEPAPTSKPAEPAVATTPAEPVMTDAEKQAKAAKNREKNLSLPVDRPKPTAALAAKDTSTDFTGAKSADLIEPGNIDLTKRPVVKNKDGSISTVRSMSFEEDGMQILIPTVVGNKVVSDKTAIDHYHKTGEHLGMFSSVKAANAYAKKLHEEQDKMYSGKKQESIEDIERDLARLKRENAATDKRIEKLKKQNASKSKVDDEKESQKEVERQIERLKKLAEGG